MTLVEDKDKLMRYIEWYLGMYSGKSPTQRAITGATGIYAKEQRDALEALVKDGFLTWQPKKGRYGSTTGIGLTAKRYFQVL